jgi:signal transduction histidine kinase
VTAPRPSGPDDAAAVLAVVAHGLLTPLAAARGYVELVQHELDPGRHHDMLGRVLERLDFMAGELRDLVGAATPYVQDVLEDLAVEATIRQTSDPDR